MRGVSICGYSPRAKGTNIGYLLPSVSFFCVLGLYKVLIICLLHRSFQQVTFVHYNLLFSHRPYQTFSAYSSMPYLLIT